MKNLSIWAARNQAKAIVALVLCLILLGFISALLGNLLFVLDLHLSVWCLVLGLLLYVSGLLLYPRTAWFRTGLRNTFTNRKRSDSLLLMGGILFYLHFGNTGKTVELFPRFFPNDLNLSEKANQGEAFESDVLVRSSKKKVHFFSRENLKLIKSAKKLRKTAIKAMKKYTTGKVTASQVLVSILLILLALALFIVVISLSCSLSCAGQFGASYAVSYFGILAILYLLIAAAKGFKKEKWQEEAEEIPN